MYEYYYFASTLGHMGFFLKSVLCDAEDQVANTQEKGLTHLHKKVIIGKFKMVISYIIF